MGFVATKTDQAFEALHSRTFLALLTIAIAFCTSTFAWEYGGNFDWRYSVIFAIALLALTFIFAPKMPKKLLKTFEKISMYGLIFFTVFVGVAAWLAIGTGKADPELEAVEKQISSKESDITKKEVEIALLVAGGNKVNAIIQGRTLDKYKDQRDDLMAKRTRLLRKNGKFEAGSMAVFGHIHKSINALLSHWDKSVSQEVVTSVFMNLLLIVMMCTEITLGAWAASAKK